MATRAFFRGYECELNDGLLTYQGTPQFVSCCCCKQHMRIYAMKSGKVYLTCLPCREELKEKRRANRTRITFVPESDDENDINNTANNNNNNV
tara:strand:+ start:3367 stop:3645 length:279 start_codon:yes stop_codon:yes gene_type:complete